MCFCIEMEIMIEHSRTPNKITDKSIGYFDEGTSTENSLGNITLSQYSYAKKLPFTPYFTKTTLPLPKEAKQHTGKVFTNKSFTLYQHRNHMLKQNVQPSFQPHIEIVMNRIRSKLRNEFKNSLNAHNKQKDDPNQNQANETTHNLFVKLENNVQASILDRSNEECIEELDREKECSVFGNYRAKDKYGTLDRKKRACLAITPKELRLSETIPLSRKYIRSPPMTAGPYTRRKEDNSPTQQEALQYTRSDVDRMSFELRMNSLPKEKPLFLISKKTHPSYANYINKKSCIGQMMNYAQNRTSFPQYRINRGDSTTILPQNFEDSKNAITNFEFTDLLNKTCDLHHLNRTFNSALRASQKSRVMNNELQMFHSIENTTSTITRKVNTAKSRIRPHPPPGSKKTNSSIRNTSAMVSASLNSLPYSNIRSSNPTQTNNTLTLNSTIAQSKAGFNHSNMSNNSIANIQNQLNFQDKNEEIKEVTDRTQEEAPSPLLPKHVNLQASKDSLETSSDPYQISSKRKEKSPLNKKTSNENSKASNVSQVHLPTHKKKKSSISHNSSQRYSENKLIEIPYAPYSNYVLLSSKNSAASSYQEFHHSKNLSYLSRKRNSNQESVKKGHVMAISIKGNNEIFGEDNGERDRGSLENSQIIGSQLQPYYTYTTGSDLSDGVVSKNFLFQQRDAAERSSLIWKKGSVSTTGEKINHEDHGVSVVHESSSQEEAKIFRTFEIKHQKMRKMRKKSGRRKLSPEILRNQYPECKSEKAKFTIHFKDKQPKKYL